MYHCYILCMSVRICDFILFLSGDRVWAFADPIGAIVISLYIIISWFLTGWGEWRIRLSVKCQNWRISVRSLVSGVKGYSHTQWCLYLLDLCWFPFIFYVYIKQCRNSLGKRKGIGSNSFKCAVLWCKFGKFGHKSFWWKFAQFEAKASKN